MKPIRLRTVGLVYGGFLLLIGLCLIVGSLYMNRRLSQVDRLWHRFEASHGEKAQVLNMLESYRQAVQVAEELVAKKMPSAELFRYAAVDDAPALEALRGLTRENAAQAALEARSLQEGLAGVSALALGNGIVTPLLLGMLIGVSVWLLRSQIIRPLTGLTDATRSFKEKSRELVATEKRMRQVLDSCPIRW